MREIPQARTGPALPARLPKTLKPVHYDVDITPNLAEGKFSGRVKMFLDVIEPTNIVIFHSSEIKASTATLRINGDASAVKIRYQPEQDLAYVQLQEQLPIHSQISLEVSYEGKTTEPGFMSGLYPVYYSEGRVGFETMFAPTSARTVFPCLDEPALKATFKLSLTVDESLTCLSNMPVESEHVFLFGTWKGRKRVVFEKSPPMSTYLLVAIAGHFNYIETNDFHVPLRIYAADDRAIEDASYALNFAVKAMETHEKSFNLKFPLPKMDMVALPGHSGGMEHWGCISYDEKNILLGPESSEHNKQVLDNTIAHELAHQWFGNIVTTEWWDNIWLNEAFASWATVHAQLQIYPEVDEWDNFVATDVAGGTTNYQTALLLDSSIGSHAIEDPNIPANSAFDSIAYLKGCSIIRQMAEVLGVQDFVKGVAQFLKHHLYGSATTEDLWAALSQTTGKDVSSLMNKWTKQVGYPLLTVHELRPTKNIVIEQSRFLQNGNEDPNDLLYPVTIHIRGPDGVSVHTLKERKTVIPVNLFEYKLNADQVGFYRVSYPQSRIHKLALQFESGFLSTKDRVGIISDLAAVVYSAAPDRSVTIATFLDFIFTIRTSKNVYVWREILGQLERFRKAFLFAGDEFVEAFTKIRLTLLDSFTSADLGELHDRDSAEQTRFKTLLFSQLKDHSTAQAKAKQSWQKLIEGDVDALNPNIRKFIFDTLLLNEPEKFWDEINAIALEKKYIRASSVFIPPEALASLGTSTKPEHIATSLDLAYPRPTSSDLAANTKTVDAEVKPVFSRNDRNALLRTLTGHVAGTSAAWEFIKANYSWLNPEGNNGINNLGRLAVVIKSLATEEQLADVNEFFKDKTDDSEVRVMLREVKDEIQSKVRLVAVDGEALLQWVKGEL